MKMTILTLTTLTTIQVCVIRQTASAKLQTPENQADGILAVRNSQIGGVVLLTGVLQRNDSIRKYVVIQVTPFAPKKDTNR